MGNGEIWGRTQTEQGQPDAAWAAPSPGACSMREKRGEASAEATAGIIK